MKNRILATKAFDLGKKIFKFNRSLTGSGNLKTLNFLKKINSKLKVFKIKSRTKVYDWVVPDEWVVKDAWIKDSSGKKIISFKENNLHLVGYSMPVKKKLNYKQLKKHLFFLENMKDAIPYKTSYYHKQWGFCMSYNQFKKLDQKETYEVNVNTSFKKGYMHYGEIKIKGQLKKEIFISTYICHPSMANDNLSGVIFSIFISKWIQTLKNRKYSYRIIFVPESIGSISYINRNISELKKNVVAGFNLTCIGDEGNFSMISSKNEDTLADKVTKEIFITEKIKFKKYSWLKRGSDEKHYCYPGTDLPLVNISRSLFNEFKEYHTSLDKLGTVVTIKGLEKSFKVFKKIILKIEKGHFLNLNIDNCIPQLSKRSLYPKIGATYKELNKKVQMIVNILSYSDGKTSNVEIAKKIKEKLPAVNKIISLLKRKKLIT